MTDIDDKLLEQQEQEQKETEAAFSRIDMSEAVGNGRRPVGDDTNEGEQESETPIAEGEL